MTYPHERRKREAEEERLDAGGTVPD